MPNNSEADEPLPLLLENLPPSFYSQNSNILFNMRIEVSACFVIPSPFLYLFNCKAIFLADPAMQSPFLLLAIIGCLTWAKLGDTDNNNLAADDSNSAALSPVSRCRRWR